MVKRTRAPKKMETPEPDKFFTTTNTYNKRRKPQQLQQQQYQRYENKSTTMDNVVATTTSVGIVTATTTTTKRIKKNTNELHYDSITQDDDYDSLEDDEEAEESEIDLLDEDDDDVDVDETTLPISSDEEEFLETQRISLPELIVKKLLQTTATTTATLTSSSSPQQNSELNVETKKSEQERCVESSSVSTVVKQTKTKTQQQKQEQRDIKSQVAATPKEPLMLSKPKQLTEVPNAVEFKEPQAIDIVKPMLEPKHEKSDNDTKIPIPPESDLSASAVLGSSKRRRGRPPKSKLTEANIQVEAKCDKTLKRTASSSKPCCLDTKPVGVLGHISYNAFDSSLHYQCQLCNVMFFNELQTYTQHLRTTHQVFKDHENTEIGIIPARKCARSQQIQSTKGAKPTLPTEVIEQLTNAGLNSEDKDSDEQPKDDKENILSKVNNRSMEMEHEPYFACGLVTLYDAGRLSLVCKYCDCVNLQEDAFRKHLLIEHQGLITPDNVKEKSTGVGDPNAGELMLQSIGKNIPKQSVEKSYVIDGATETVVKQVKSTEQLMATQTPETPPPEEDEEQENKYHNKIDTPLEDEPLSLAQEVSPKKQETTLTTAQSLESINKQKTEPKKDEEQLGEAETKACAVKIIEKPTLVTTTPKDIDHVEGIESERDKGDLRVNKSAPIIGDQHISVARVLAQQVEDVPQQPKKVRKYRKRHSDIIDLANQLDTKRATRQSRASCIESPPPNKTQRSKPIAELSVQRNIEIATTSTTTTTAKTIKTTSTTPLEKRKRLATTTAAVTTVARSKQSLSLKKEKKDINTTTSTQVREGKQLESTPLLLPPSPSSQLSVTTIATTLKSAKKRGRGAVNLRKQIGSESPSTTEAIDDIKTETTIKAPTTTTTNNTTKTSTGAENVQDAIEMTDNKDNKEVEPLNATADTITSLPPSLKPAKSDIYCEICQKVFNKKSRLVEHRRLHTGELPFQCDKCDKRFRLKSRLTEHKMRHLGVKSFKCNVCGLALATKQDLSQHQRYHTDKRPHACPHCPKAFVRSSDFKIHLRIHTGEKPYVCDICNQSFRANQNLYVHRKMHLGVKDYICEFCEKAFMRKIDLRVHMRSHTGEKPFKCEICSRSFSSKFNVRTHIQRLHVANANGVERKKPGRKPNDLRAELERQKELIEELRNQLAQRVKTEQMILQQHCQQQQSLLILPTATATSTSITATSKAAAVAVATSPSVPLSSPTTFELMATDVLTEQAEQKLNNQQSNNQPISIANIEIPPMSLMSTTSEISPQTEKTTTITTATTVKDVTLLNPATPQPHDISILAVFTAQPHGAMQLNNLSTNSITATMTPLRLQLPTTGQTSTQKKERKITSYFNVLGQKS